MPFLLFFFIYFVLPNACVYLYIFVGRQASFYEVQLNVMYVVIQY